MVLIKCIICKTDILNTNFLYSNVFNIPCCKSEWCIKKLKSNCVKLIGLEKYFKILDSNIRENNVHSKTFNILKTRYDYLDITKLNNLKYRKLRNVDNVYTVETSIGRLIIGINYAYCLKDDGYLMKVYNLNEYKESILSIRNRLNVEFLFYLDLFLKILDLRTKI